MLHTPKNKDRGNFPETSMFRKHCVAHHALLWEACLLTRDPSHGAPVTSVTWPEHQHGARVPWLMFYKLPRGSCTTSVPIFPPRCMHSAWDYIPQLQLPHSRNDSHLTNPKTLRKIQIKEKAESSDLSSVCAGCKEKKKNPAWIPLPGLCVSSNGNLRTSISLTPDSSTYLHAKCN